MMDYDGSFNGWFESDSMEPQSIAAQMKTSKMFKGSDLATLESWVEATARAESAADLPRAFERMLESAALPERMLGKLGFGEGNAELLSKEFPTRRDIYGSNSGHAGSANKPMPILIGEHSAAILARTMEEIDPEDDVEDFLCIGGTYLHAQGRWLTTLEYVQSEDPIFKPKGGAGSTSIWIPVSQALAIAGNFDENIQEFLREHAGDIDRQDLLALAKSVPPNCFFQGDAPARAWVESHVLESEIAKTKLKSKKPAL